MLLEWIGIMGSFGMVARSLDFLSTFKVRPPLLEVLRELRDSFPNEAGKWTLISRRGGKNGALLELWQDTRCSSRVEMVMSGNCLSFLKGVKDPFEAQEGRWDFSRDASVEKGLISQEVKNLLVFLKLGQEIWGSS